MSSQGSSNRLSSSRSQLTLAEAFRQSQSSHSQTQSTNPELLPVVHPNRQSAFVKNEKAFSSTFPPSSSSSSLLSTSYAHFYQHPNDSDQNFSLTNTGEKWISNKEKERLSYSSRKFNIDAISNSGDLTLTKVQNSNKKGLGYVNNVNNTKLYSDGSSSLSSLTTSNTSHSPFSSSMTMLHSDYLTNPHNLSLSKSPSAFSHNMINTVNFKHSDKTNSPSECLLTSYKDNFSAPGDPYAGAQTRTTKDETAFARSIRHPCDSPLHVTGSLDDNQSKFPAPVHPTYPASSLPPLSSSNGPRLVTKSTRGHGKGGAKAPNSNSNLTAIAKRNSNDSRAGLEADGAAAQWGGIGNNNGISPYIITRSTKPTVDPLHYTLTSQTIGNRIRPKVNGNFDLETGERLDL